MRVFAIFNQIPGILSFHASWRCLPSCIYLLLGCIFFRFRCDGRRAAPAAETAEWANIERLVDAALFVSSPLALVESLIQKFKLWIMPE